jgi:hypothetical protein
MNRKTLPSDLTRREYQARLQGIQEGIPETVSLEGVNLKKHGVVEMPLVLDAQAGENPDSLFFIPLTSDILEEHPIDLEYIRQNPSLGTYTDFDPEELGHPLLRPSDCAERIWTYLFHQIYQTPRVQPPPGFSDSIDYLISTHWERASSSDDEPNYMLDNTHELFGNQYEFDALFEDEDIALHPHMVLVTVHNVEGHEDSLLYGELVSIIGLMKNRLQQVECEAHIYLYSNFDGVIDEPSTWTNSSCKF